jgi:acetyl-CoA C-acetyltransferase
VIVRAARTPIGKAHRGALSDISGPHLAGRPLTGALDRAGVTGEEIDDDVLGCAIQEGTTGYNVARQAALRAGLPTTAMLMEASEAGRRGLSFHSSAYPLVSGARR